MGCFEDSGDRDLEDRNVLASTNSIEECTKLCKGKGEFISFTSFNLFLCLCWYFRVQVFWSTICQNLFLR